MSQGCYGSAESFCGHKRTMTKAEAKRACRTITRPGLRRPEPYKCTNCGSWHVGHRNPRAAHERDVEYA